MSLLKLQEHETKKTLPSTLIGCHKPSIPITREYEDHCEGTALKTVIDAHNAYLETQRRNLIAVKTAEHAHLGTLLILSFYLLPLIYAVKEAHTNFASLHKRPVIAADGTFEKWELDPETKN